MPVETSSALDDALHEANATIVTSLIYEATDAERRLNELDDSVSLAAQSSFALAAKSDAANLAFSAVKTQVVGFVENSRVLMAVLDEVAGFHPFIRVAVSVFKAALELELARRENDDKILALNVAMCDMMSILTLLKGVVSSNLKKPGADGLSIEDRLLKRMNAAIESIETCAKTCDTYHKRKLVIKIFTSVKWKAKFTQIAQEFADHKAGLQDDLQMFASLGVAVLNQSFAVMSENVEKIMDMVFKLMRSPQERKISVLISSRPCGAEQVLNDDLFLEEIMAKDSVAFPSLEDNIVGSSQLDTPLTPFMLRKEVEKDLESVLAENRFFESKFNSMRTQLDEVRVTITHETDRTISTLQSGPHEEIADQDIYDIWKEMRWKRSVEAKHLALAIRDHFGSKRRTYLAPPKYNTDNTALGSDAALHAQTAPQITEKADTTASNSDAWALQYITIARIQPLLEALDDDASSFVTVAEVNAFTSARPTGWSLQRWISYWTCGFEMTFQWYYLRIRALLASIDFQSHHVLPANRASVGSFLLSPQLSFVERLLSGLQTGDVRKPVDWNWDSMFAKFNDYIVAHERQLETRLRRVKYLVDEGNTLTSLIVEGKRPETYVLPVLFLLLRRVLVIIRYASHTILDAEELRIVQRSLNTLLEAIRERVDTLQAIFRIRNMNNAEQFKHFSFGLYAGVFETRSVQTRTIRDLGALVEPIAHDPSMHMNELNIEPDADEPPLCFSSQVEELDAVVTIDPDFRSVGPIGSQTTLEGQWGGHLQYPNHSDTAFQPASLSAGETEFVRLVISAQAPDGTITGNGIDAWGPFEVHGAYGSGRITFQQTYVLPELPVERRNEWYYVAEVQDDLSAMKGSWGIPRSVLRARRGPYETSEESTNQADLQDTTQSADELVALGSFTLTHRPFDCFTGAAPVAPGDSEHERIRAWWTLAIKVARNAARLRMDLQWDHLEARRRTRERYIALLTKRFAAGYKLDPSEEREIEHLVASTHPNDLYTWNAIRTYRARREIVHHGYSCDHCNTESIVGSRLVCVDCAPTHLQMDTYDLCFACFRKQVHAQVQAHSFIQLRTVKMRFYQLASLNKAKGTLSRMKRLNSRPTQGAAPCCAECKGAIALEKSYWQCMDCLPVLVAATYVCAECNDRIERQKPWLLDRRPSPQYYDHNWSHTLVLVPGPDSTPAAGKVPLSTEARLSLLEMKFDRLAADVKACLLKLSEAPTTTQ